MDDLSYKNKDGYTVLTAKYHRNRGTCCKTSCLHCPFGHTQKNLGFGVFEITDANIATAQSILDQNQVNESSVAGSLLAGAFGKPKDKIVINNSNKDNYRLITLKDFDCGVIEVNDNQLVKVYLEKKFQDQNIQDSDILASL